LLIQEILFPAIDQERVFVTALNHQFQPPNPFHLPSDNKVYCPGITYSEDLSNIISSDAINHRSFIMREPLESRPIKDLPNLNIRGNIEEFRQLFNWLSKSKRHAMQLVFDVFSGYAWR